MKLKICSTFIIIVFICSLANVHNLQQMLIIYSLASATIGIIEPQNSLTFLLCVGREQDFRSKFGLFIITGKNVGSKLLLKLNIGKGELEEFGFEYISG